MISMPVRKDYGFNSREIYTESLRVSFPCVFLWPSIKQYASLFISNSTCLSTVSLNVLYGVYSTSTSKIDSPWAAQQMLSIFSSRTSSLPRQTWADSREILPSEPWEMIEPTAVGGGGDMTSSSLSMITVISRLSSNRGILLVR